MFGGTELAEQGATAANYYPDTRCSMGDVKDAGDLIACGGERAEGERGRGRGRGDGSRGKAD